jgi:hypothetical protein
VPMHFSCVVALFNDSCSCVVVLSNDCTVKCRGWHSLKEHSLKEPLQSFWTSQKDSRPYNTVAENVISFLEAED